MPLLIELIMVLLAVVLLFSVGMYVINSMALDPRGKQLGIGLLGLLALLVLVWVAYEILTVGPGGTLNWGHR